MSNVSELHLQIAAYERNLNESKVADLVGECTGDLEDLDDGLSEVFESLLGLDESPCSSPRVSPSHHSEHTRTNE